MQNAYVGDIGDFAKYGLLRAICGDRRLGVAWYLHPSPEQTTGQHTGDGRHTKYLSDRNNWRDLDPQLFDTLRGLVRGGHRNVRRIEDSGLLGDARFAGEPLDIRRVPIARRAAWRDRWFQAVKSRLTGCNLIFADPDNGLYPDERFKPTQHVSAKRIPITEVAQLADGRPTVIYHHNTRFRGGHHEEIRYWMERLPGCQWAWYWRRWSNRTFFVLNPDTAIERRLIAHAKRWRGHGNLHPPEKPVPAHSLRAD